MAKMQSKNKYILKAKIGKAPLKEYEVDIFDIETEEGKTLGGLLLQKNKEIEELQGRIKSLEEWKNNVKEWQSNVSKLLNIKFAESEDL